MQQLMPDVHNCMSATVPLKKLLRWHTQPLL